MPKYPLRGGAVSRLPAHLARSALALGIALALPVGVLHAQEQAVAENADSSTTDESAPVELDAVQVQGIRASVMRAQDIKRDADTFVDSVTAQDIGALPDRSVTETLSRIPGVTIDRFLAVGELQLVQLGDPVDQVGDRFAELADDGLAR